MDSILIFTKTLNEHPEIIDWALKHLEQDNFTLQSKKCLFYQTKINYLGMIILRTVQKLTQQK